MVDSPIGLWAAVVVLDIIQCTPAGLKQSPIEIVSLPENWSFDTMLTWTRTRAMKRMTDKSITDSARKKACMVQTELRWPTVLKHTSALSET